jgi:hypothetical protein
VTTRLENPTRYHLAKVVQNNISRFTLENSRSVPPPTAAFNPEAMGAFNNNNNNNNQHQFHGHHQLGPVGSAPPNIFGPRSPLLISSVPLQEALSSSSVLPTPHSSLGTSITSGCSELLGPMAELEVDSDLVRIRRIKKKLFNFKTIFNNNNNPFCNRTCLPCRRSMR